MRRSRGEPLLLQSEQCDKPTMRNNDSPLHGVTALDIALRHGRYSEILQAVHSPVLALPAMNRLVVRALRLQGQYQDAKAQAMKVDWKADGSTPADVLLHVLEWVQVEIFHANDQLRLVVVAETIVAYVDECDIHEPGDWAEVHYILARIQLAASKSFVRVHNVCYRDKEAEFLSRMERAATMLTDHFLALEAQLHLIQSQSTSTLNCCTQLELFAKNALLHEPVLAARALLAIGQKRRHMPCSRAEITQPLEEARKLFGSVSHGHGRIDVARQCALLAVERDGAELTTLDHVYAAYTEIQYATGMLSVTQDAASIAHKRGDNRAAQHYLEKSLDLAREFGMGTVRSQYRLQLIDLHQRSAQLSEALNICMESMHNKSLIRYCNMLIHKRNSQKLRLSQVDLVLLPGILTPLQAGFKQLIATAYGQAHDRERAFLYGFAAVLEFEACGALDSASNAVLVLASQLGQFALDDAKTLLETWLDRDIAAGRRGSAIDKLLLSADLTMNLARRAVNASKKHELLESARGEYSKVEVEIDQLPDGQEAVRLKATLHQHLAVVSEMRGCEKDTVSHMQKALDLYSKGNMHFQAANCAYILGLKALNQANEASGLAEFRDAYNLSLRRLKEAAKYYENSSMRTRLGQTYFMMAKLCYASSQKCVHSSRLSLLNDALHYLVTAADIYDNVRREFGTDDVLHTQQGKRNFVAESRRIYHLLFMVLLCSGGDRSGDIWYVVQQTKARSLTDVIGLGSRTSSRLSNSIPEKARLALQEERDLATRLSRLQLEDRGPLLKEQRALYLKFQEDPHLSKYMEIRTGATVDHAAVRQMQNADAHDWTAIDWIVLDEDIYILIHSPRLPIHFERLPIKRNLVMHAINDTIRNEYKLAYERDPLETLHQLIGPLEDATHEGDILVLSPSDLLHGVPFHALQLCGRLLIERNPIVYTMSLSLLRFVRLRRDEGHVEKKKRRLVAFGDPSGDRLDALAGVRHMSEEFGFCAIYRDDVTRHALTTHIQGASHIHFNGHAKFSAPDPLESHLNLHGGEVLTARDVFELQGLDAELVTLAACESGVNEIKSGDEPLGLIPAFHFAGASGVLATLWRADALATAEIMSLFYSMVLSSCSPMDKARALQQAVLQMRQNPEFSAPYFWAPYVLHGDWR